MVPIKFACTLLDVGGTNEPIATLAAKNGSGREFEIRVVLNDKEQAQTLGALLYGEFELVLQYK